MASKWKMVSTIGKWHRCSKYKAFRFYLREHRQTGQQVYFADYRVDDLVSRHHELLTAAKGVQTSFTIANHVCLELTREALAEL